MPSPSLSEPLSPGARGRDGRSSGVAPSPSVAVGEVVGGAPKLLSAINRNGLVLFLVVRIGRRMLKLAVNL